MSEQENIETDPRLVRKEKLKELKSRGEVPYKKRFDRSTRIESIREQFEEIESGENTEELVRIAGRLMAIREHGKATFADLKDGTGNLQLFLSQNVIGEKNYQKFINDLYVGDIIGVEGVVFKTRRGELSVKVQNFEILSKSLRPLPEKWHGLRDVESRYRRRYVDLIVNEQVREVFIIRAKIIKLIRQYLEEKGFLEVETPMLQPIPGGATARPFITHHNALDMELYLRIAPELYLKRLVVGGFEKVFELNRSFRNEGLSVKHNPEFTMLELYQAYSDYEDMMWLMEDLLSYIVIQIKGALEFKYQEVDLDFSKPLKRMTMIEAINEIGNMDISLDTNIDTLRSIVKKCGGEVKSHYGKGRLIAEIFEEKIEEKITGPMIIYDYPAAISPLARKKKEEPRLTERFEVIAAGREVVNAFSELNDPIDQAERFKEQIELRDSGDMEAQDYDFDYIRALEYGLPPTGGAGVGIDRLVMLLTDRYSIREVILFPHLRPEKGGKENKSSE